jgi:hypothetical protein
MAIHYSLEVPKKILSLKLMCLNEARSQICFRLGKKKEQVSFAFSFHADD